MCVGLAERREHQHRLLEHGEVLARLLLVGLEGAGRREGAGELLAEPLLLLGQRLQARLQVARHEALDAGAVEADELAQEGDGQQRLAALLALLVDDDLGQHRVGQVVAGLGVEDDEIPLALHHRSQVVEGDVGARLSIVEPPVGVLLDDNRFLLVGRRVRFVEHERSVDCWTGWSISVHKLARSRLRRPAVCWACSDSRRGVYPPCETGCTTSRMQLPARAGLCYRAATLRTLLFALHRPLVADSSAFRTLLGAQDEQGSSHHRHRRRRAHAGRLVQRRAGKPARARTRQGRHQGGARAGARGDRATCPRSSWARSWRPAPGQNPARQASIGAGIPGRRAGLGHEPAVRLGPARGGARRPADRARLLQHRGRRRPGEHEPGAALRPPARRHQDGRHEVHRHHDQGRPVGRLQRLPHGQHGRERGAPVADHARGAGPLRRRLAEQGRGRQEGRQVQGRDRPRHHQEAQGRDRVRRGRVHPRRRDLRGASPSCGPPSTRTAR